MAPGLPSRLPGEFPLVSRSPKFLFFWTDFWVVVFYTGSCLFYSSLLTARRLSVIFDKFLAYCLARGLSHGSMVPLLS